MKKLRKTPIQVYLEPEQEKMVNALSLSTGKSKAAIIRSCISTFIAGLPPEQDPAMKIIGIGESGKKDVSKKHDDYLTSFHR